MSTDNEIIHKIRKGDNLLTEKIYNKFRKEFIGWVLKCYHCPEEDAKEAYQLAFFIFYQKIMTGELAHITSSLKTYLFSIGKNKVFEHQRYHAKWHFDLDDQLVKANVSELIDDILEKEEKLNLIEQRLDELGDPCKTLLQMTYYQDKSMNEITTELGYKNVNTTKNLKYKCLQRLKKMVHALNV